MSFLLDTNVVSELRPRSQAKKSRVHEWAASVPQQSTYLASVVLYELENGVRLMEHRDAVQGAILRKWMTDNVLVDFRDQVISFDAECVMVAAGWNAKRTASTRDLFIAAIAYVNNLTLATRNVKDFRDFPGLAVINPWEE